MQSGINEITSDPNLRALALPWHAVYTRHQHEKAVAGNLAGKGFEVFLPLYATARRWKDRTKQLLLPLFPCYVFFRGGVDRWLDVISTPGIHSLVGSGRRPAAIPQVEIDAVRLVIKTRLRMEPHPFLKCGDWVRVKCGPLEGIEGILIRKKNRFRLVLSVELLKKSVALEVDAFAVERARRRDEIVATEWVAAVAPARLWA